jgi:AcrR family transcriptional regulator
MPARILGYDSVLNAARQSFLTGSGVDMQSLARALSVSRATLYRVVRSRDRLLGDVFWSLGERTLRRATGEATGAGAERLVDAAHRLNAYVIGFEPLREFLRSEPMAALRVLITPAGGVHCRFVDAWKQLFLDAERNGELTLQLDAEELAYVFVRIGESMIYSDLLAGREPDIRIAATAQRALLRNV